MPVRIKHLLAFASILALGLAHGAGAAPEKESAGETKRPNVVFIISDDQAWTDYGFMGHPTVRTPNLDKLAAQSILYERGYVTAPLCRPSLASMATGLHPHQHRIRGNDPAMPEGKNPANSPELWKQLRDRMKAPIQEHDTFIRLLAENGYATLQTGKWWEGNPSEGGFAEGMTHGDVSRGGRHGDKGLEIGRKTMDPIYDFVDRSVAGGQPFFIWYGVFLPHDPHNAPDRLYNQYKDLAPNESTARYWANVAWFDETCGQLLDYLGKKGIDDETIVVYACDNGYVPNPDQIGRFVRSKREQFEAGIRTPIMIRQLGVIEPSRQTETLASVIDIAPTILRACGIEPPEAMAGLDLRDPAALAERNRVFTEVYEHDIDLDRLDDPRSDLVARVIIDGWNKLVVFPDRKELYDLKTDNDDRHDLAAEKPELVARLTGILNRWMRRTQ
jgi:uncharacterized sulfatase